VVERLGSSTRVALVSFDDFELPKREWNESSFKRGRESSLNAAKKAMDSTNDCESAVLVVDDVMHLRSMRREVYVAARDREYMMVVLYLSIPLDVARQRNANRALSKIDDGSMGEFLFLIFLPTHQFIDR